MTRFLKVDESRFPLVTFTLTGPMDDEEFERLLARVSEQWRPRSLFAQQRLSLAGVSFPAAP